MEAQPGSTGAKIETPNTQIAVGAGVTGVTGGGGKEIESGSTATNSADGSGVTPPAAPPSGGGGGDGDSTVYVESILVTGAGGATSLAVGETLKMIAEIEPSNATNKNVEWSVTPSNGTATIDKNGLLKAEIVGTVEIRAKAKDGSLKEASLSVTIHKAIYNTNKETDHDTIEDAVDKADAGNVITLAAGTYNLEKQLNIEDPLTLSGTGSVTIKAVGIWPTKGNKHLLDIYTGTSTDKVALTNITCDSDDKAFGIQAYGNAFANLNNVTIKNSEGIGLTVNGSTVVADNLNTSGNAWSAVNVDPGDGVKTPSIFTLTGSGVLAEDIKQIWSDGANVKKAADSATVSVTADGYTSYKKDGDVKYPQLMH